MSSIEATHVQNRTAREQDTDAIIALAQRSLGEDILIDRKYWDWKHLENPFGRSACMVAELGGELVGIRAFMRWTWNVGPVEYKAVRAVDTATHPNFRGKGIFSKLTRALVDQMKADGIQFIFNTPNRSSMPGYLKMGWENAGRTSLMLRPMRPFRLIGSVLGRATTAEKGEMAPVIDESIDQLLAEPRLERILATCDVPGNEFFTPRSISYLRWRYAKIPGFAYRAVWDIRDNAAALLIYRIKHASRRIELRLSEVLAGRTQASIDIGRTLVSSLIRTIRADFASGMAASMAARWILLGSGFLPAPKLGPTLTVRNLGLTDLDPVQLSNWRFSIGDLEIL